MNQEGGAIASGQATARNGPSVEAVVGVVRTQIIVMHVGQVKYCGLDHSLVQSILLQATQKRNVHRCRDGKPWKTTQTRTG